VLGIFWGQGLDNFPIRSDNSRKLYLASSAKSCYGKEEFPFYKSSAGAGKLTLTGREYLKLVLPIRARCGRPGHHLTNAAAAAEMKSRIN
jgi:hypothetical protein